MSRVNLTKDQIFCLSALSNWALVFQKKEVNGLGEASFPRSLDVFGAKPLV